MRECGGDIPFCMPWSLCVG